MKLRDAILKAADHIEANPSLYDFHAVRSPDCGTPGCMVGWVAHFLGRPAGSKVWAYEDGCLKVMGVEADAFLDRVKLTAPACSYTDPNDAVKILRLYADKYHPAEPVTVESELARIFADAREFA